MQKITWNYTFFWKTERMKCRIRLRITQGLTQNQQIYLLSTIIVAFANHFRDHPETICRSYKLKQENNEWFVEINFDSTYLNNINHLFTQRLSVLNPNIFQIQYINWLTDLYCVSNKINTCVFVDRILQTHYSNYCIHSPYFVKKPLNKNYYITSKSW